MGAHGEAKYQTGRQLRDAAEWPSLRVELRRLEPGAQADLTLECTKIDVLLYGRWTGHDLDLPRRHL